MLMRSNSGMGAYPTDSFYDPDRPSWLPFWIDDPTESAQKLGMFGNANVATVYPNPPAPLPPVVQPDLTGQTVDVNAQIAQTAAANAAQNQAFFNALAATLPNSPTPPKATPINWITVAYVAGAAVLGIVVLKVIN